MINSVVQLGHICTSEELGEGAAETSQSQHSDRSGWKQGGHCKQESCRTSGIEYKSTLFTRIHWIIKLSLSVQ